MRRLVAILTLVIAVSLTAAPVLAGAESFQFRSTGNWAEASYSNVPPDKDQIPPGSYFSTYVWAADSIVTGGGELFHEGGGGVCVFHDTFTVDASGEFQWGQSIGSCADGAHLTVSRRLTSASVAAEIPVVECVEYDPETEECIDVVDLGTIVVDLAWTGEGPIKRYHGSSSGGSAGDYQYTSHGTGASRAATPSGRVDLVAPDGTVTDLTGGLDGDGHIQRSQDAYTEVLINHGE
jgi:hypothetical protein